MEKMVLAGVAAGLIFLLVVLVFFNRFLQKIKLLRKKKHQLQHKIIQQKILLNHLFDHSLLGAAILQINGQFIQANKSLSHYLGYEKQDILKMNFFNLLQTEESNQLRFYLQELVSKRKSNYQHEYHLVRKNGELIAVKLILSLARDHQNQPDYYILQMQNITSQKKIEERLNRMAFHDPLTGLANRHRLGEFVKEIILSSKRNKTQFALMFLDIDHFKNINDTMGHVAGDLILQIFGERLLKVVRETDMVARLAGDEFILLITDIKQPEDVSLIAENVLKQILQSITVQEKDIYMTTSIGISLFPHDGETIQTLLKNADLALYRAKEIGRNNYQFYAESMAKRANKKLFLQHALAEALLKDEFILYYQPEMEMSTRRILGVEAFLRCQNNKLSHISSREIIAVAEETGLILPISHWLMKTACRQLKKWREMGLISLCIAFNCSGKQFKQATFVEGILNLLNEFKLPPQCIELEITEDLIMQDQENALKILYALKDAGFKIVIDDFGMGYWSLNNLRRFSVDKIKIDHSFINHMTKDETSFAIIRAIIAMANKLKIKTIAEGIETKAQYDLLLDEGCTEIQGFYLSQPLNADSMTKYLQEQSSAAIISTERELIS